MSLPGEPAFAGGMNVEQAMSFCSKFGFKEEGLRVIKEWYKEALKDLNVPSFSDYTQNVQSFSEYDLIYDAEAHSFSFVAPGYLATTILRMLAKLIDRMIKEECAGDDDIDDFNDVELSPNSTRLYLPEEGDTRAVGPLGLAYVPSGDPNFPIDIRFLPARCEWISMVPDKEMGKVITKQIQERIMNSTGVKLVEDLVKQIIFVASNDEGQTARAVQKLRNVERFSFGLRREDHQVFYAETVTDFQVCFVRLPTVGTKLENTTLLDPKKIDELVGEYNRHTTLLDPKKIDELVGEYNGLVHYATVRCCARQLRAGRTPAAIPLYQLKMGSRLRPVVEGDMKHSPSVPWGEFIYAEKGDWVEPNPSITPSCSVPSNWMDIPEEINDIRPLIRRDNEQPPPRVDVISWTQGLPDRSEALIVRPESPEIPESPSQEASLEERLSYALGATAGNTGSSYFTSRQNASAARRPVSQYDDPFTAAHATPRNTSSNRRQSNRRQVFVSSHVVSHVFPAIGEAGSTQPSAFVSRLVRQARPVRAHGNHASHAASLLDIPMDMSPADFLAGLSSQACSSIRAGPDSGDLIDLADGDLSGNGEVTLPADQGNLDDLNGLFPNMIALMPAEHLDAAFGNSSPTDLNTIQDVEQDELSTRQFHQTMRQQAPRNSKADPKNCPPTITPSHECLSSVEFGLEPIMRQMRQWNGPLTLKAELGRFIIQDVRKKEIYNPTTLNSVTPEQAVIYLAETAKVRFSNLITTLPSEAQWILEMEDEQGKRIWKDGITTWPKVRFIFSCLDTSTDTLFEVEMNGEDHSYEVKTVPYTFGLVNVHCTTSNWDYRCVAQGYQPLEQKYQNFMDEVLTSMTIPKNRTSLEVYFQVHDAHQIQLKGLRVRRECDHENVNGTSVLHIDQVEDMYMRKFPLGPVEKSYMFRSHNEKTTPAKTFTRRWYEVSVTSKCADAAFKENVELDIGEEAQWTYENLVTRGLLWDLCHPMSGIVTRGDGLGFFNEESRPSLGDTEQQAESSSSSSAEPLNFVAALARLESHSFW